MPFTSKSIAVFSIFSLCFLTCNCQSEKASTEELIPQEVAKPTTLEVEVLKLLQKETYDRDLIFEQTHSLSLEQKLSLVNRLAEEHKIERMNMLKARVKIGTIHSEQSIEVSKKRQQKALEGIDSILREKAQEKGLLKE